MAGWVGGWVGGDAGAALKHVGVLDHERRGSPTP